jgi:argininosuccinate lyase
MTIMKGLPLAYNKDLQEDKAPVFDSYDSIAALSCRRRTACYRPPPSTPSADAGSRRGRVYITATRLADWLVMELGIAVPGRAPCHRNYRENGGKEGL